MSESSSPAHVVCALVEWTEWNVFELCNVPIFGTVVSSFTRTKLLYNPRGLIRKYHAVICDSVPRLHEQKGGGGIAKDFHKSKSF